MSLHAQTTHNDLEDAAASSVVASVSHGPDVAAGAAFGASADETISIELNFNAFADDVPPTEHAKRVANYNDPSIQDFADQALELAALRAELKRLQRDYDALLYTMRLRDVRLQTLQDQLASARSAKREPVEAESQHAPMTEAQVVGSEAQQLETTSACEIAVSHGSPPAHELSTTIELPVPATRSDAVVPEAPRLTRETTTAPTSLRRQLIPLDSDGAAIVLQRDIITLGRTTENDICVPSRAVSRDHARLLMSARSVTIVDMDSGNGCFVNDQPVKKHKLRHGDVLRIGDRSFRFESDQA